MPRKKKSQKEQIGVDFPELDSPELDELNEKPKTKPQKSTKSLDDLPAYLGKNLDGSTAAQIAEWQRAKPQLSIDQLKHIYIAGHDMTLQEIADKINSISTDKNGNARYANFVLAVAAIGRGTDHSNIDDLRMRFYSYLELTQLTNMKISNMTAYLSVGMTQSKATALSKSGTDEMKDLLTEIQAVCASYRESITADGKLNPVTSIFWQKNFDGMQDRKEQVVTVQDPLGEMKNKEDIRKKYADIIIG